MCGRYTLKSKGIDLQRELNLDREPVVEARFNIAPTQAAPVVLDTNPRELVLARWGFTPRWAKDVHEGAKHINARAESLAEALQPARTARTVRVRGGRTHVTDGPYAEAKELVGGIYLIEARDMEEATAIAARIPSASVTGIEVRPVWELREQAPRTGRG